jgi:hyperosmotically inducible periplasmic protein
MTKASLLKTWLIAIAAAVTLGACAGSGTERSTGQYVDDKTITTKVKTALIEDEQTKARNINVDTYKGVVQLSGFVESTAESERAESLAKGVDGVKSVQNSLRMRQ